MKTCKYCGAIVEEENGTVIADDCVTAADGSVFCDEWCAEQAGYSKCEECGEWVKEVSGMTINGAFYCSEDCAHEAGYSSCDRCGQWVRCDDGISVEDSFYCDTYCAERDGWRECRHCGEWVHKDYAIHTTDNEWFCRESCAWRSGYGQCDHCGEWGPETEIYPVSSGGCIENWCESCCYNYSTCCDGCGERFDDDDLNWNGYCSDCSGGESEYLHEYGYTPRLKFFGGDGYIPKPPMFLGVELETDGGHDRGSYCDELNGIEGFPERFYMTEDSSLENGVEITSHPMTLAHHIERMDIYEGIKDAATSYGFKSHDGGRCGLHVHVNRNFFGKDTRVQDAGGYKVMRLMQRFERQLMIFSRRTSDNWCRYRTREDYTPKKTVVKILHGFGDCEPSMLSKANSMKYETNHSQCLNFQHPNTFEFRIFRGTLKWETYFACLGFVDGICRTAKARGSIWVEDVDWYTLINEIVERCSEPYAKECLVSYLDEKGLR